MTSITSLVVLLLAAYCYAAPFVPGVDYTTEKATHERELTPLTGDYYTTDRSSFQSRGESGTDSDEFTTERPSFQARGENGRDSDEVTTEFSVTHARREQGSDNEFTTELPSFQTRGENGRHHEFTTERSFFQTRGDNGRDSDEVTTEFSVTHARREQGSDNEFTTERPSFQTRGENGRDSDEVTTEFSVTHARREQGSDNEFTTERSSFQTRGENGRDSDEVTTEFSVTHARREQGSDNEFTTERSSGSDIRHERSMTAEDTSSPSGAFSTMNERSADVNMMDNFVTVESNTDFDSRVGSKQQRESIDMDFTTVDQPASSGNSGSDISGTQQERETPMEQGMTKEQYTATVVPGTSFSEGTTEKNLQPAITRN